jgi:hypothetical protein
VAAQGACSATASRCAGAAALRRGRCEPRGGRRIWSGVDPASGELWLSGASWCGVGGLEARLGAMLRRLCACGHGKQGGGPEACRGARCSLDFGCAGGLSCALRSDVAGHMAGSASTVVLVVNGGGV